MKSITIYGLHCSSNPEKIRYIGQTGITVQWRLNKHLKQAERGSLSPVHAWIRKHVQLGEEIQAVVICKGQLHVTEKDCIAQAKKLGWQLLNATDGGDGVFGYKHTEERKKKCAVFGPRHGLWGKPLSEQHRKRISESKLGKKIRIPTPRYTTTWSRRKKIHE